MFKSCLVLCLLAISTEKSLAEPPASIAVDLPATAVNVGEWSQRVWLSDLQEQNVTVGAGEFGKLGRAGSVPGYIHVQGISSHRGLGMHADAHVEYVLGKKYHRFRASVSLNDTAGGQVGRPVDFRVLGDGKLLWTSMHLYKAGRGQPCLLDISDVDVLALEVSYQPDTTGSEVTAQGVWIDPYVSSARVSLVELQLYSPERFLHAQEGFKIRDKIRTLFDAEKFGELDALAVTWRKKDAIYSWRSILGMFYTDLGAPQETSEEAWKKHFARLERWKRAKPDSITPLIVLGVADFTYAWQIRGNGFANTLSAANGNTFEDWVSKARKILEQAEHRGEDPNIYKWLLDVNRSQGGTTEEALALLEKGRKLSPHDLDLYGTIALNSFPEWGGQPGDIQKLAARLRKEAGGELGEEIYFRIAFEAFCTRGLPLFLGQFKYEDVLPGMWVALRDNPDSDLLVNGACRMACTTLDYHHVGAMLVSRIDAATFLASRWGSYGEVEFWRTAFDPGAIPKRQVKTLGGDGGWSGNIAFLGDTGTLMSSGQQAALQVWKVADGSMVGQFAVPTSVRGLAVDSAGQTAIAIFVPESPGSRQAQEAWVFKVGSDTPQKLQGHTAALTGLAMSRDGKRCATVAGDKTAKVWNLADLEKPTTLKHPAEVLSVIFSPDGKTVATTNSHGTIWLWNAETGEKVGAPLNESDKDHVRCRIRYLPDGKQLMSSYAEGTIRRWNLSDRTFQEMKLDGDKISSIEVSPDGKWLAVGHEDGTLDLVAPDTFKVAHKFVGHFMAIIGISFEPDGKTVATSSVDGAIKLWAIQR